MNDDIVKDDAEGDVVKAKHLGAEVERELVSLAKKIAKKVGVHEKFVWAEIAYRSTQAARRNRGDES